jgi:hypothetical protein
VADETADAGTGTGAGGAELIGRGVVKVDVDVDDGIETAEKKLRAKGRDRLGDAGDDVGEEAGDRLAAGMGRAIARSRKPDDALSSVAKRANAAFEGMKFAGAFAGLPVAAGAAAGATVGILAAIPLAAIAGGAALVAEHERVAQSMTGLAATARSTGERAASGLVGPLAAAADDLGDTLDDIEPMLRSVFDNSAPVVDEVTDAVDALARNALPGLVVASSRSAAGLSTLDKAAGDLGQGISSMARSATEDTDAAAANLERFGRIGRNAMEFVGEMVGQLNSGGGPALDRFSGSLDQVYDIALQLTAQGGALTNATLGFIDGVSGGLAVVGTFAGLLNMLPAPVLQFVGTLKALDMMTMGRLTGQFDGLIGRIRDADGARGKFAVGMQALGQAGVVGAAGIALAFLAEMHSRAAKQAADQRNRVRDLSQALVESNGAIDANVRSQAAKAVQDMKVAQSGKTLGDYSKDLNISLRDLTDAYLGLPGAQQKVDSQLQRNRDSLKDHTQYQGDDYQAAVKLANGSEFLQGWLAQTNTEFGIAAGKAKEVRDAMAETSGEVGKLGPVAQAASSTMVTAMGALYDPMKSAEDRGTALVAIMDRLNGRVPSLEESVQSLNDRFRGLKFEADGAGDSLVSADGSINTLTGNGSKLQDVLVGTQKDMATMAQAMRAAGAPTEEINAALGVQSDRLRKVLESLGITPGKIQEVIDTYGLMPSQVATQVTDLGTLASTRDGVQVVMSRLRELPPNTPVRVDGLTADAIAKLREVGFTVTSLPDGSVSVAANTQPAVDAVNQLVRTQSGRVIRLTAEVVRRGIPGEMMGAVHDGGRITGYQGGGPVGYEGAFERATVGTGVPWAGARLFGEKGSEIAFPDVGSYVATAVQTDRMTRGMAAGRDNAHTMATAMLERPAPVVHQTTNHITIQVPGLNGLSVADLDSLAIKIDRALKRVRGPVGP